MTNEQQQSPIFGLDKVRKHLYNTIWGIKPLLMNQLEDLSRKLSVAALFANDTLFKSPFFATKAPKLLFYCIKQCQEIMTLGKLPYTMEQVIVNMLRLLTASQIFPTWEFDTWENMMVKSYPALKTFIHEAYSHHLNSMELCNTSSSLGYALPAMYHMLDMGKDDDDSATDITVTTFAAAAVVATTASSLGQGTNAGSVHPGWIAAINQSIAPAFNQFMHNQLVLQNQIAAIAMAQTPLTPALVQQYIIPPVPHVTFPIQTATLPANCWFWPWTARTIPRGVWKPGRPGLQPWW
jgi:hypothetical protein